jgi:hypothetical protein
VAGYGEQSSTGAYIVQVTGPGSAPSALSPRPT